MSKLDFRLVNDRALQSVDSVLSSWLPGGKRQGGEYVVTNPRRSDSRPGSFSINTANGIWSDFATGDKGGDLIALVAYVDNTGMGDACRSLASFLNIDPAINNKPSNQAASQHQPPAEPKPAQPDFVPIRPIPEAALKACPTSMRNLGKPSMYWDYLGEDGKQILLRVMRFDKPNSNGRTKDYRPWCYGIDKSGKTGWRSKMPTSNRPLYGLNRLATAPADAPILLGEGEKAADSAQILFPGAVSMAWPGGSKPINKADFSPLAGRTVWYWYDFDQAGKDSIEPLKKALSKAGGVSVTPLKIELFAKHQPGNSNGKPSLLNAKDSSHWKVKADAAEAVALGWTSKHISLLMEKGLIHAPTLQTPPPPSNDSTNNQGQPERFREGSDGIYYFSPKYEKYQFVGGPLKVLARSRDKLSEGWGLLVEFEDYDKQTKVWNIPGCYLVSEGGNKAVEGLIHRGYMLSPQRDAKNQLREFLGGYNTPERVRLVNRIGWQGKDAFMLPDKVIGKPKEPLHYYSDSDLCKISTSGKLEQWKENIAKYGNKNIFLTFALSTAFAGPFIDIKDTELFGVHFFGDSSLGKVCTTSPFYKISPNFRVNGVKRSNP
uniref:DUF927 domain-containing protein n=1 Tax=uncultured Spongiibacter sp. TaxID=870896 RepID=UPI00259892CD